MFSCASNSNEDKVVKIVNKFMIENVKVNASYVSISTTIIDSVEVGELAKASLSKLHFKTMDYEISKLDQKIQLLKHEASDDPSLYTETDSRRRKRIVFYDSLINCNKIDSEFYSAFINENLIVGFVVRNEYKMNDESGNSDTSFKFFCFDKDFKLLGVSDIRQYEAFQNYNFKKSK